MLSQSRALNHLHRNSHLRISVAGCHLYAQRPVVTV